MSSEESCSSKLQAENALVQAVASSRLPSPRTVTALRSLVEETPGSAIERAAFAVLRAALNDFSRTFSYSDVRRLEGGEQMRSLPALSSRLNALSDRLHAAHGADQEMRPHYDGDRIWLSFGNVPERPSDGSSVNYRRDETGPRLTWLGKLAYGRLPSHSMFAAPGVFPTLLVSLPFFLGVISYFFGLATARGWPLIIGGLIIFGFAATMFRLMSERVTQAKLIMWPFVSAAEQWGNVHVRTKDNGKPLFQILRFHADCPICGDLVDLETGRLSFKGRIVGECRSNPLEHVFTFDHTTSKGRWAFAGRQEN